MRTIDLPENRDATPDRGAGHRESWWPLALYMLAVTFIIVLVVVTLP